jgi:hypothetical protein
MLQTTLSVPFLWLFAASAAPDDLATRERIEWIELDVDAPRDGEPGGRLMLTPQLLSKERRVVHFGGPACAQVAKRTLDLLFDAMDRRASVTLATRAGSGGETPVSCVQSVRVHAPDA